MKRLSNILKSGTALLLSGSIALSSVITAFAQGLDFSVKEQTAAPFSSTEMVEDTGRKTLFNDNWKFNLGDVSGASDKVFDDSLWRDLTLPHDWSIEQDFDKDSPAYGEGGFLNGGTGWYRKTFVLPQDMAGQSISLEFGGIYMDSTIFVNGTMVGNYPFGYSTFAFDISDHLITDGVTENVIAVKVVHQQPSSRWYSGSGIYRDVHLVVADPVHVSRYGTYITTPSLEEEYNANKDVTVNVKTKVKNDLNTDVMATVRTTFYDVEGNQFGEPAVSEALPVSKNETYRFEQDLKLNNPQLWSVKTPTLYDVVTEVLVDNKVVDTYHTDFGFRWFEIDANEGFSLNGEYMKLQGVCMHHDQGALGSVSNYRAVERQMEIMKDMGVNAIRSTHNQASDELLDICNKMGLLLIDEAYDAWWASKKPYDSARFFEKPCTHPDAEEGMTWAEYDIKNMVNRGKNSPAIIMWSLGNEIQQIRQEKALTVTKQLMGWVNEIDDTREITLGDSYIQLGWPFEGYHWNVDDELDSVGFNYGSFANYDKAHHENPKWKIYGSEISSAVRSRGKYAHPDQINSSDYHDDMHKSSYDNDHVPWGTTATYALKNDRDRKWFAGQFIWTGFDYIGEPTSYAYPAKSSYFGAVDTAGFEKDAFYLYQSQWTTLEENPMVHLLPHWNWEDDDSITVDGKIPLRVYSNAPKVELFLNGNSLGEKEFLQLTTNYGKSYQEAADGNLYLEWRVPFEKGELIAVAKDLNGNTVATDIITTADKPAGIELTADRQTITADGYDLSYITVDIVDKDGNFVPTADNMVNFSISGNGKIVGVDNGDPACVERYKDTKRSAFSGKALVIVQSTKNAGSFTLTAKSSGLASSQITGFTIAEENLDKDVLLGYDIPSLKTVVGGQLQLPATVSAAYHLSGNKDLAVTWDNIPEGSTDKIGFFTVTGIVAETGDTVKITVQVVGFVGIKEYKAVTLIGDIPELPDTVDIVFSDGVVQARDVTWNKTITDKDVEKPGIFEITGSVQGEDDTAKAVIRVAESSHPIVNVSRNSGSGYPKAIGSWQQNRDYISNVNDGNFTGASRWTNWTGDGSRRNDWIGIDFGDINYSINNLDLYYYIDGDCLVPKTVVVEYWDAESNQWIPVSNQDKINQEDFPQAVTGKRYIISFDEVETNKIRLNMTSERKSFGIVELEVFAPSIKPVIEYGTDASLEEICVNGQPLEGFAADKLNYSIDLEYADPIPEISATLPDGSNASIFILQSYDKNGTASIEVVSEDKKTKNVYSIQLNELPAKLGTVAISVDNTKLTEDDIVPINLEAQLENGEVLDNGLLDINYKVNNITGKIGIVNGQIYAYDAGTATVQAEVTYKGITMESALLTLDIAENPVDKTILSYESVAVTTGKGVAPILPNSIRAVFDIGLAKEVAVVWDKIPEKSYAQYGSFTVKGTVEGQDLQPTATVLVKGILATKSLSVTTPVGMVPNMPANTTAYYSDGTTAQHDVVWDSFDHEQLRSEGTVIVIGKLKDLDIPVTLSVRVSANTEFGENYAQTRSGYAWPMAMASFTNDRAGSSDYTTYLNDGIVNYQPTPKNRWCDWSSGKNTNWVGVLFGVGQPEKRNIDNLEMHFYKDSGADVPQAYKIQYYTGDLVLDNIPTDQISHMDDIPDHILNDDSKWVDVTNLTAPETLESGKACTFNFDAINTHAIRIVMTAQSGKCMAVTELKAFEKRVPPYHNFETTEITVNGKPLDGFDKDTTSYTVSVVGAIPEVKASVTNNAAVTVIPAYDITQATKVIVTAENGVVSKTYNLNFTSQEEPLRTAILEYIIELAQKAKDNGALEGVIEIVKEKFNKALDQANAVLENAQSGYPTVTQADIDKAVADLLNAMHYLEFKADKTELNYVIAVAEKLAEDKESYIPSTYLPFESALAKAKAVAADGNAMNDEIVPAWKNLLNGMANLRYIPDKSKLEGLKVQAEAIDTARYTAESVAVLNAALARANVVLSDKEADKAEVQEASDSLVKAMAGLVAKTGTDAGNINIGINGAKNTSNTKTSDNAPIALALALATLSGLALFGIKKEKTQKSHS